MTRLSFPSSVRFSNARHRWAEELAVRARRSPVPQDFIVLLSCYSAHSEFYRARLAGVRRWSAVPILEREDIAKIPLVGGEGRLFASTTSGTCGVRVTVINDAEELEFRRTLMYRPFSFYDLPNTVRQLIFLDIPSHLPLPAARVVELADRSYVRWMIGARSSPAQQLSAIRAVRPHIITGIPSAMIRLAEIVERKVRTSQLRVVSPAGEYLTKHDRHLLEDSYGVPVYDRYGATESGAIAWQCPLCNSYHANVDEMLIEPQRNGVVITPYFLTTQPLVRYRLGDQVAWDSNPAIFCQVRLPCIVIQEARRDDWLYDGYGQKVSPLAFGIEQYETVNAWRIHQTADGKVTVFVSWRGRASAASRQAIAKEVRDVVRGQKVRVVNGIEHAPTGGKFKRVTSAYAEASR